MIDLHWFVRGRGIHPPKRTRYPEYCPACRSDLIDYDLGWIHGHASTLTTPALEEYFRRTGRSIH